MSDPVNAPSHYQGKSGRQSIEITHQFRLGPDLTQAFDYIVRAGRKTPDPRQDLRKAAFYLRYAANLQGADRVVGFPHSLRPSADEIRADFDLCEHRGKAIELILSTFPTRADCLAAAEACEMAAEAYTRSQLPAAHVGVAV